MISIGTLVTLEGVMDVKLRTVASGTVFFGISNLGAAIGLGTAGSFNSAIIAPE